VSTPSFTSFARNCMDDVDVVQRRLLFGPYSLPSYLPLSLKCPAKHWTAAGAFRRKRDPISHVHCALLTTRPDCPFAFHRSSEQGMEQRCERGPSVEKQDRQQAPRRRPFRITDQLQRGGRTLQNPPLGVGINPERGLSSRHNYRHP
jgi:hypothetical protein